MLIFLRLHYLGKWDINYLNRMTLDYHGNRDARQNLYQDVCAAIPQETTRLLEDSARIADETEEIGNNVLKFLIDDCREWLTDWLKFFEWCLILKLFSDLGDRTVQEMLYQREMIDETGKHVSKIAQNMSRTHLEPENDKSINSPLKSTLNSSPQWSILQGQQRSV